MRYIRRSDKKLRDESEQSKASRRVHFSNDMDTFIISEDEVYDCEGTWYKVSGRVRGIVGYKERQLHRMIAVYP